MLGGPVGVGDVERYPYLKTELDLVRMRLERQLPLLGVCLGAQMMAHALGARVYPGTAREIGWGRISLTEAGWPCLLSAIWREHPFCIGMGIRLTCLPERVCWRLRRLPRIRPFAAGKHALALQFHVEADVSRMEEWLTGHACELMAAGTDICGLRAASVRERNPAGRARRALLE